MLTLLGEGEGNTVSHAMRVGGRFTGVRGPVHGVSAARQILLDNQKFAG